MSRPWHIWLSFAACACLVAAAVGWLSIKALQADANEAAARVQAVVEENARLALWRMDSAVASLIALEAARPYFVYEASYPADRAYGNMFNGLAAGNRLARSPLTTSPSPDVLLHFQFEPSAGLTSPQVAARDDRATDTPGSFETDRIRDAGAILTKLAPAFDSQSFLDRLPPLISADGSGVVAAVPQSTVTVNPQAFVQQLVVVSDEQQHQRGQNEYQARARFFQKNIADNTANPQGYGDFAVPNAQGQNQQTLGEDTVLPPLADVQLSTMRPLWWDSHLLLVRRVQASGREYVQGCVLDWDSLRTKMLADAADLLPHADLVPHMKTPLEDDAPESREVRLLASLPVSLIPGSIPIVVPPGLTPVQLALVVGWAAMLAAAAAVAALLQGVLSLSERRAAFVSAVTHELRTPLTTFRMYSEMLAQGMVKDEADRHRYLETLRVEADRLTHLVANVLSYARLERARPGGRIEEVSVDRLLDVATERLIDRASEAGFTVVVQVPGNVGELLVAADPSIVEQILFNLVDNASKYAASAADKALTLSAIGEKKSIVIRLCDRGPGISVQEQRRLFQPFRKSASEASVTAPGVGLGLALSRRLARDMRGDLRYESGSQGACFALSLPLVN